MAAFKCSICCDASFPTRQELQDHIQKIMRRVECSICGEKFTDLEKLVEHLAVADCGRQAAQVVAKVEPLEHVSVTKVEADEEEEGEEFDEAADGGSVGEREDENAEYYCQMCAMHFSDVEAHLGQFHEGEEVVLEEEDPAESHDKSTEDLISVLEDSTSLPAAESTRLKRSHSATIDTSASTRKFVKVDKFWQNSTVIKDPLVQKYVLDNGQVKKVSQDELNAAPNTEAIIEISQCEGCDQIFPLDQYKEHNCTKASAFQCTTCNTNFPTFKSLRLHRRMHEPLKTREIEAPVRYGLMDAGDGEEDETREMFICGVCNKTYDKQYEEVHAASHVDQNNYNCDMCNRKFFTEENLEMHMRAHTNNKKFACSYCKKRFVSYDALNDHMTKECQKRQYACQYCGRRFARPHEKVKHERIHTGEKPHICEICGKAFRVSYCLTLHLRTHSGARPYMCKHCGKRFKSHSVYNHHLLTHSDVRNYKCPYCPKAFKTGVQLAGHKNSHTKPFSCTECNRPFASLYAVRQHMETHKRENSLKFECWICGALYSRAFALKDHMKQQHHHGGEAGGKVDRPKAEEVAEAVEYVEEDEEVAVEGGVMEEEEEEDEGEEGGEEEEGEFIGGLNEVEMMEEESVNA